MREFYASEKWQKMDSGHPGGAESTQWLLEIADLQNGSHILDLCCGRGDGAGVILSDIFRQKGFRVTGVDQSEKSLAEAERKYGSAFHYLIGDGRQIPLEKDAADAVLCECSLSLFGSDIPLVLWEVSRVLKAGGYLMLSDLYRKNSEKKGSGGNRLYTKQGWLLCLAEAGFVLQEWKDISAELQAYCMEYLWKTGTMFPACAHGFCEGVSLSAMGYFLGVWRRT